MEIHAALKKYIAHQHYTMSPEQEMIISHESGPLLVIAGPGSGKTYSLSMLAMNLFLHSVAEPSEFVLCTYTEKAALEIRERITHIARAVKYPKDVYQMRIDTIHGICRQIITEHLHATKLANGYETLDLFPQQLLIYEHLETLCSSSALQVFKEMWGTRWQIVRGLQFCFDRIVDELIAEDLERHSPFLDKRYTPQQRQFLESLKCSYFKYQRLLMRTYRMDFAHIQKQAYNLLTDPQKAHSITQGIRYVLVDEYQDTNYIQEQILFKLAANGNLCVVGDEDQALYRFRGATVRNLLEFSQTCAKQKNFPSCKEVKLTTNYRSHPKIIQHCNDWMSATDWHNSEGIAFRTQKIIQPVLRMTLNTALDAAYNSYPAVLTISENSVEQEASQFAELVVSLKQMGLITDYHQVALLLHSVRPNMSNAYTEALRARNIPYYCPRARKFFEQDEVRIMIACLALLLNYEEAQVANDNEDEAFALYMHKCNESLQEICGIQPNLSQALEALSALIVERIGACTLVTDCFYHLLAHEPFFTAMSDPQKMGALVEFSNVLGMFQQCYIPTELREIEQVQRKFFHTFLRLLQNEGVNQRELPQQMLPPGHVQIMTVHQAKGLEFPVVVVGRLESKPPKSDSRDRELRRFYHKPPFEPENRVARFDLARNYYVAFSRAEHLLVLSAGKRPNEFIAPFFEKLPRITSGQKSLLPKSFPLKPHSKQFKQHYSFTQHIASYESCPKRYEYFHERGFLATQTKDFFLGQAVHQTLESIHRMACSNQPDVLDEEKVCQLFAKVADCLEQKNGGVAEEQRHEAQRQVLAYFRQNQHLLQYVKSAEQSISFEKENYILIGKVDLFMELNGKLCLFDFKTESKKDQSLRRIEAFERQLNTYAHILEQRDKKKPERLFIYWTGEEHREEALMEVLAYQDENDAALAGQHFDEIVTRIQRKEFTAKPQQMLCTYCDLRSVCVKDGTL